MANEATGGSADRKGSSKGAAESDMQRNLDELQAQIETVKEDLASITATLSELLRSGVREGRSRVEQKAEEYRRKGAEEAGAAIEGARAYGDALEEKIVQNPLGAVLAALGLGFIVGLMSRR